MTKVLKEFYFDTIHCTKDSNLKVVAKKLHNKFKGIKNLYYGGNQMFVLQEGLNLSLQHLEPRLERTLTFQKISLKSIFQSQTILICCFKPAIQYDMFSLFNMYRFNHR